jgi:hypothetical protein
MLPIQGPKMSNKAGKRFPILGPWKKERKKGFKTKVIRSLQSASFAWSRNFFFF